MANTYTKLNIHVVITVYGRQNLLLKVIREELFKYISGYLTNTGNFSLAVNGYTDHVHIFFEIKPDKSLSEIVQGLKANSSKWLNERGFIKGKFRWQKGYGAFSYARTQRETVINYIKNQERHHSKHQSFKEEYLSLLDRFEVKYDNKYLFEFYD